MSIKRLIKQYQTHQINPAPGISIQLNDDDPYVWNATISGPEDTPYFGGIFLLDIKIPKDYPFKPPKINFKTKIYHPGISQSNGTLCCCYIGHIIDQNWSPVLTIQKVLVKYRQNLYEKTMEEYLDYCGDRLLVYNQFKNNRQQFNKNAQQWTKKYAMNCSIQQQNKGAGAE